jgi:SAM-dependent methyltransferase
MTWNSGYVTDVSYTSHYIQCISPAWLSLAALGARQLPPDIKKPFRYLDLGCGYGTTIQVEAAGSPHAEFVGVDFMPEHVAYAEKVKANTGLTNLTMIEASFEELVENPERLGEPFDFVVMHGVYTWVSDQTQQAIRTLFARHIKPGGILYMGYNAMPGWTEILPLQRIIHEQASHLPGTSVERMMAAAKYLRALKDADAKIMKGVEFLGPLGDAISEPEKVPKWIASYLAHEYLNDHWRPLYFTEMCEHLSSAKMTYLGDVKLMGYVEESFWTPEQKSLIDSVPGPVAKEAVKDTIVPSSFRRDLFVRGRSLIPEKHRDRLLGNMIFALTKPVEQAKAEFSMRQSKVNFDDKPVQVMAAALAERPHSIYELQPVLNANDLHFPPVEIAAMLLDTGTALPVTNPDATPERARAFNLGLMKTVRESMSTEHLGMVSHLIGSGIILSTLRILAYDWLCAGKPDSPHATEDIREAAELWEPIFVGLKML